MLLGTGTYRGAPFPKHAVLPVEKAHFDRSLELFLATVDENFSGPKAEEAKGRALSIADTFARLGRPARRPTPSIPRLLIHSNCSDPSNDDARKGRATFETALKTEHAEAKRQWRFDVLCLLSLGAPKALAETNQEQHTRRMNRITPLAAAAAALLALAGCDQKTSDDLKQKAEEARQTVETKAKEAKEAADRGIEQAKPKVEELIDKTKEAAKDAEPRLKEFGEKAKEVSQEALKQGKELTDSAAEKLKEATGDASPDPATPTPAP